MSLLGPEAFFSLFPVEPYVRQKQEQKEPTKRWGYQNFTVRANTKSEARSKFKRHLSGGIPPGSKIRLIEE